jgi:predicted permease
MPPRAADAVVGDLLEELARRQHRGWPPRFPYFWVMGQAIVHTLAARTVRRPARTNGAVRPTRGERTITMSAWARESRDAMRSLLRRPVFFATAVATLTIGIGLNAAMFSVVNRLLIKPLPYPDADRLVQLSATAPDLETIDLSYPDFHGWRAESRSFESMAAFDDSRFLITSDGEPERIEGAVASASLLQVLRLEPTLGRFFTREEERPGHDAVVVLSHALWRQRYGRRPEVLGRSVVLNGRARTVVGVGPADFRFPEVAMLWVPLAVDPAAADPDDFTYDVVARLKEGVTIAAARAEGETLIRRLAAARGTARANVGAEVYSLKDADVSPQLEWASLLLLAAVGAVLLAACLNLAVLVATRGMARRSEIAVRMALGATRSRIVVHHISETAILTTVGALGGVLLGSWLVSLLNALLPAERPFWMVAKIDGVVLAFVALTATASTLVVGAFPAFQTTRGAFALRGSGEMRRSFVRAQRAMVALQVAMSLALITDGLARRHPSRACTICRPARSLHSGCASFAVAFQTVHPNLRCL